MSAVVAARALLVVVFAIAGIAKALDRPSTRRSLVDFGVPERLAPAAVWALVGSELAVAALLAAARTARLGGALALALLVAFSLAAGRQLAAGQTPACNCFGQVHSEPVGPKLLVRNALLAAVALVVVIGAGSDPGPDLWAWARDLSDAEAVLVGVAVALGVAVAVLARRTRSLAASHLQLEAAHRELEAAQQRLEALHVDLAAAVARASEASPPPAAPAAPPHLDAELEPAPDPEPAPEPAAPQFAPGLPVGTAAPSFALESGEGEVALDDLLAPGKPLVLLFVAPTCRTCHDLLPKPKGWADTYGDVLSFALVTAGTRQANEGIEVPSGRFEPVLFDPGTARSAFEVAATPGGVLVSPDGTIETETVYGVAEIAMLVMRAAATERAKVPLV